MDEDFDRFVHRQNALMMFSSYAMRETNLRKILSEAVRLCAKTLGSPSCAIYRYRPETHDLLVEAAIGQKPGLVVMLAADPGYGRALETTVLAYTDAKSALLVIPANCNNTQPYGLLEVSHTPDATDSMFLINMVKIITSSIQACQRFEHLTELVGDTKALTQELHHRVRNNLQLINGMLSDQLSRTSDGYLRRIARRVMSMARIYDHILGDGIKSRVDFGNYINLLCHSLPELQEENTETVQLVCEVSGPIMLDIDMTTTLGLALVEVISNSYEHAFPDHRAGLIRIGLTTEADDRGMLTVTDNGIGLKQSAINKRIGIGLIKRLMQKIKGTAVYEERGGTVWVLRFPINQPGD